MSDVAFENEDGGRVELADNGSRVVLGELGTADDGNPFGRLFTRYEDGRVFDSPDPRDDDFDTMLRRDGKARSVEQVLTLPLRWATLAVEPQDGDRGEAALVRETLTRPANAGGMSTPLELVVAQMASAVMFRRAFFEKVWRDPTVEPGRRLVYDKLAFRPSRTCTLIRDAKTRAFRGFEQKARRGDGTTDDVRIPADKAFVYLHGQHRDPLRGSSDMETVWSCFESKQKIRFLWFQFLERNVIPYGVFKTKDSQRLNQVAKLKSGGVVAIDTDEDLSPFQASGEAAGIFREAMDWLSAEMSQSVLASFTDLAQQGSGRGSFALSRDQSDLFLQSRHGVLAEMAASLTSWVAADLVRWNFGPDRRAPRVTLTLTRDDQELVKSLFDRVVAGPPSPQIPAEFSDMLVEKVAAYAGLDVDRVRKAIEARPSVAANPSEALQAGIANAARLVEEAGVVPTAG